MEASEKVWWLLESCSQVQLVVRFKVLRLWRKEEVLLLLHESVGILNRHNSLQESGYYRKQLEDYRHYWPSCSPAECGASSEYCTWAFPSQFLPTCCTFIWHPCLCSVPRACSVSSFFCIGFTFRSLLAESVRWRPLLPVGNLALGRLLWSLCLDLTSFGVATVACKILPVARKCCNPSPLWPSPSSPFCIMPVLCWFSQLVFFF